MKINYSVDSPENVMLSTWTIYFYEEKQQNICLSLNFAKFLSSFRKAS